LTSGTYFDNIGTNYYIANKQPHCTINMKASKQASIFCHHYGELSSKENRLSVPLYRPGGQCSHGDLELGNVLPVAGPQACLPAL